MKARKVIVQVEMLTDKKIGELKLLFREYARLKSFLGKKPEVRVNVVRETK